MKNKKIIISVISVVVVIVLIVIGVFVFKEHSNDKEVKNLIKEGKEYLVKGDYSEAKDNFKKALDISDKNEEAKQLYSLAKQADKIENDYNNNSFDEAIKSITTIKGNPYYSNIQGIIEKKESSIGVMKEIDSLNDVINNYLTNNDFNTPIGIVNGYYSKDIKPEYKDKLTVMMNNINNAKKQYESSNASDNKPQQSQPVVIVHDYTGGNNSNNNDTATYDSVKSKYLSKLNQLADESYAEYENNISNCCDADLPKYAERLYTKWDAMINEIWGVLSEQLPEDEMAALTDDELAWIAEKEQKGEQNKSNRAGAHMNFVMQGYYVGLADMTRDRCYILVNMYMQ